MSALAPSHAVPAPLANRGLAGVLLAWWRSRTVAAPRQLRLLETLPLGPKRSVAMLEVDGQRFLAGMGADGVHTLLEIGTAATKREEHL